MSSAISFGGIFLLIVISRFIFDFLDANKGKYYLMSLAGIFTMGIFLKLMSDVCVYPLKKIMDWEKQHDKIFILKEGN